ncbi:hypothetical protein P152DRAFT_471668 [Eremomyces bilateralis CBS 781.70]|uniref:Uncharacterized protein n=1 Tax=Eremomyces bilateralis CBS 781.70 TaxID=1392243 RepID=A0A6G1GAY8_9PEZI|nr:uncharacterized protein P152DRAFT_471668 [Eremomyces bilateralis CBS 781.70]KAF1815019.1 hypothetical protein P152DRAFT_471668 [Eremomyces bilateralis CBS 781.70]
MSGKSERGIDGWIALMIGKAPHRLSVTNRHGVFGVFRRGYIYLPLWTILPRLLQLLCAAAVIGLCAAVLGRDEYNYFNPVVIPGIVAGSATLLLLLPPTTFGSLPYFRGRLYDPRVGLLADMFGTAL